MDENDRACDPKTVEEYLDFKELELSLESELIENPEPNHINCRCQMFDISEKYSSYKLKELSDYLNRVMNQYYKIAKKEYIKAGSPYGDGKEAVCRWLKEKAERCEPLN